MHPTQSNMDLRPGIRWTCGGYCGLDCPAESIRQMLLTALAFQSWNESFAEAKTIRLLSTSVGARINQSAGQTVEATVREIPPISGH